MCGGKTREAEMEIYWNYLIENKIYSAMCRMEWTRADVNIDSLLNEWKINSLILFKTERI